MAKNGKHTSDCFVSVVAILHNSETGIRDFVEKTSLLLRQTYANYELVLIDNGSKDTTVDTLIPLLKKVSCVRVIRLSRYYEEESAIYAGLDAAIGDFVVVMTPEYDPIDLIPGMVDLLRQGKDIVYGISKTPFRPSILSRLGSALFYVYIRKVLHISIPTNTTNYIGLNRRAINALTKIKAHYRHVRLLGSQVGFKVGNLSYTPLCVQHNRDRNLFEEVNRAFDIVVTYSRHPLRFVSWLGLLASVLNLLYAVYVIAIYFLKDRVAEGWTTLSLQTTTMFFFVFLILTVLSEYIGRILEETKSQPSYHVMEELTSKVLITDETRRNIVL